LENYHLRQKLWPSNSEKTSKQYLKYLIYFRVVVVLENRVYVYNFADLRLIDAIDTCNNPKGLCALNPDGKDTAILATPHSQKGYVRIAYYSPQNTNNVFKAHDTAIEAIVLSKTGDYLATASETGTIIRFFETKQMSNNG
jgi:WD40 repeat protein